MRHPRPLLAALVALCLVGGAVSAQNVQTAVVAAGTTDVQAVAARARGQRLVCITATETTAADGASLSVHNGTSAGDPKIVSTITLTANESTRWCPSPGPLVNDGVYLDRTGTIEVTVSYIPL